MELLPVFSVEHKLMSMAWTRLDGRQRMAAASAEAPSLQVKNDMLIARSATSNVYLHES